MGLGCRKSRRRNLCWVAAHVALVTAAALTSAEDALNATIANATAVNASVEGEAPTEVSSLVLVDTGRHCSNFVNLRVQSDWNGGSLEECAAAAAQFEQCTDHVQYSPDTVGGDCGCATDDCIQRTTDANWNIFVRQAPRDVSPEPIAQPEVIDMHAQSFSYHKEPFPLNWEQDGRTIALASIGLVIAASGGIGGGGILVPLFILVLGFHPKHAIALSNFTILGGAIANTWVNAQQRHPVHKNQQLIDWDVIVIMEPLTIFGAVFGSLMSKVLPNIILTFMLAVILAFMGERTLRKGLTLWAKESKRGSTSGQQLVDDAFAATSAVASLTGLDVEMSEEHRPRADSSEMDSDRHFVELDSDNEGDPMPMSHGSAPVGPQAVSCKIIGLTVCFIGTVGLTVLKGGGNFPSPLGFECGSGGFWLLYFGSLPWVLGFAVYFRSMLVDEFERKVARGYVFSPGEVQWNAQNTIRYPILCALSGLFAGLFGVGGGIVKGPLMLEMGILPSVASASAATMILYTSAAASTSFVVFGMLHTAYGALFFCLGLTCTAVGQATVNRWVKKHDRQSPIVLSIGIVIALSSLLVGANTLFNFFSEAWSELFVVSGVCGAA